MATALQMVNALRGLLREEEISAIATSDELTTDLLKLINRAARSVLHERDWTFDTLEDGVASFMAPITGTTGSVTYGSPDFVFLPGTQAQITRITERPSRLVVTDDASFGNTSWKITRGDYIPLLGGYVGLVLNSTFQGTTQSSTAAWTVYSDEIVLPSTVRRVLSVRHEETPIRLEFVQRNLIADSYQPRSYDRTQSQPELVMVGGGGTTTYTGEATTATSGTLMRIWPPPSEAIILNYSYMREHAALSETTDSLLGVPETVIDLITQKAFYYGLISNLENDPRRADLVRRDYELDLVRVYAAYRPDPYRRNVPSMHGSSRLRNPYRRWPSTTVPSP